MSSAAERQVIPRSSAPFSFTERQPGTWAPMRFGERLSAMLYCPACGRWASLDDHAIGGDGAVVPSLSCPHNGCDYHEHVRLEGWPPGAMA